MRCPVPISFANIHRPTLKSATALQRDNGKAPALRSILPPAGIELRDCTIWYLGEEGRALINLQMTNAGNSVRPSSHLHGYDLTESIHNPGTSCSSSPLQPISRPISPTHVNSSRADYTHSIKPCLLMFSDWSSRTSVWRLPSPCSRFFELPCAEPKRNRTR